MANGFSDLLSRIASPFYADRDIDEEERRRIEELRAQGVYVPQERRIAPFGYGSGRQRREDLTAIRTAIQPEQKRRMDEYLARAGEQERLRMAQETQNTAVRLAAEAEAKRAELEGRQKSTYDPQGGQGFKEYLKGRLATPPLTDTERAELTVRQRGLLPYRQQEATATKLEQDVERGAAELPTVKLEQEGKQDALRLAAEVRNLLPPNYAGLLAEDTALGKQLAVELGRSKLRVAQSPAGKALLQSTANQSLLKSELDILALKDFQAWLNTEAGQAFAAQGNQYGLNIRDQFNTMQARLETARRGGLSGGLGQFLPPNFYGPQQGQSRGGGRTAIGVYSGDEEIGGQPARLTPPVTAPSPPPRQPVSVPTQRGQRPVRQTQPTSQPTRQPTPAPVAPTTSPAQRVPRMSTDWNLSTYKEDLLARARKRLPAINRWLKRETNQSRFGEWVVKEERAAIDKEKAELLAALEAAGLMDYVVDPDGAGIVLP